MSVHVFLSKKTGISLRENRLNEANTLWEYILTTYGYCPESENLREERIYHAIFQPTFHRHCFLSLHITPTDTDAILTFGYLAHIWEWKRYLEILSAIREMQEFPMLSDDAFVYLKNIQMEALREKYVFSSFPDEESVYLRNVQMTAVPLETLQYFEQKMQEIQPFELGILVPEPQYARDGITARGIVTDRYRTHRFDIWPVPLTGRYRAFFLEFIRLGSACVEEAEQKHLKEIQRYLY
ncbi:hypothetical protein [Dictyobacter arantiisoli]|uniref:Uncharacterized protein n=1 Tax=Dictyobacter arantiisoli TaxID=2014874 RepID=A0A5A5TEZ0_9CHLR|nr:hypothetical protein [Dictyobacter arantiisoli]GCF09982.1 hypothetical protein KDI_35460 [Dictyobacter arantiisoli]